MAIIILLGSLCGMGVILYRKIPEISELPKISAEFSLKEKLLKLKEKIKILNPFKSFSGEVFLQKILSKIRILILKTDSKTFSWLQKLRERSKRKISSSLSSADWQTQGMKKKKLENDNYWQELKKVKKEKRKFKN